MNRINLNLHSQSLASEILRERGVESEFLVDVKICSNMRQVFDAISEKEAEHFAVLSSMGEPIEDFFGHIKGELAAGKTVSLALFFKRTEIDAWNSVKSN